MFGDEVLKFLAERMRHSIRGGDIAARAGGDEFPPPCPLRRWGIPPTWPHQWHFPCGSSCSMGDRAQELFQRVKADYAKTAQAIQTFREEAGG